MRNCDKMDYKDFIVSTPQEAVFLHRCFRQDLDGILKEGLRIGPSGIYGTATPQPAELERAEVSYRNGAAHGDVAVVLRLPRELWDNSDRRREIFYCLTEIDIAVKPEFVSGWIDRESNKVHLKE